MTNIIFNLFFNTAYAQTITASDTIQMPPTFINDIFSMAQNLFNSWGGWIATIIGVLLALVAIDFIIGAFRK